MAKFTGELSGSLAFIQGGAVSAQMIPGAQSLNVTGSFNISGSQLTFNGRNVMAEIDALSAGADPEVGTLRIHSASMLAYTASNNVRVDALEAYTSSVDALNAATSSYFLSSNAGDIISSSNQIIALGFTKDDLISGSQQILNLGFARDVVSGSQQILDLGFVTSSNIASYNDLSNVPGGIISASVQIADLGFISGSEYSELGGIPNLIVSSSDQIKALLYDETIDFGAGVVTASKFSGDGSGLTNLNIGQVTSIRQGFDATSSLQVTHNFGSYNVNVAVYDTNNFQLIPEEVQLISDDVVKIDFASDTAGHAVVSLGGHIFTASLEYSDLTSVPQGIVSSSAQITALGFGGGITDIPAGTVSSSAQITELGFITASTFNEIVDKPSGLISSSTQIGNFGYLTSASAASAGFGSGGGGGGVSSYTELSNIPGGIISSSAQVLGLGFITGSTFDELVDIPSGLLSSSAQIESLGFITSSNASIDPLNTFTGSIQTEVNALKAATGSYITSLNGGIVSSSAQIESLGFITSSDSAPAGTVSSSAQISALGFITGSHSDVEGLNSKTGSYAVTASNHFTGSQFFSGSLIPEALSSENGLYDLGSLSKPWRDLYLTTGSLNFVKDGEIFSTVSGERNAIRVGNILITTASLAIVNNSGEVVQNIAQATVSSSGEVTSTEQTLVPSNTVSSSAQIESLGFITSSTSPSYDGNRVISNEDLGDLFTNSVNPGTSGSVVDFLNAVFYPNNAPTITTGNQTIVEFTPSGSTIVTLAATDPESQNITFSLADSYTDNFVVIDGNDLNLNRLPSTEDFNTDNRGDGTLAHPVIVKATDTFNSSTTKTIYINVTANSAPVFRETGPTGTILTAGYSASLNENNSSGEVAKIYFTDADSDSITITSASDANGHFSLTKYSNYISLQQVTASLDFESITTYNFSVTASDEHAVAGDDNDAVARLPITITVTDNVQPTANDQSITGVNENSSNGASAGTVTVTDSEGDTTTISNSRLHSLKLNNGAVATGSYGGTSQATDPTEDAFTFNTNKTVVRKDGVFLNSDLIDEYVYEITVTDAFNNGTDKALVTIPIADDPAPSIGGDTTLYIIESAVDGDSVYDSTNGFSGTTTRFTSNQSVTWAVSSSNDFAINSSGYLTVNRDISGSATVGGDQIDGTVTATNSFGTTTDTDFTVNITDNTAPTITFTNTTSNLNTNKARPSNNLVTMTFSDTESDNIDYNSFSASFGGHDLVVVSSGNSRIVRANSNLAAGTYNVTASIADVEGFATRTSSHTFTISQAVVGTLTGDTTSYIIESAESGSVFRDATGYNNGYASDLNVSYNPNYGSQTVQAFTSSNAAVVIDNSGGLTLGVHISGSTTGSGDTITSDITFQDQYGNVGSGSVTINVFANQAPTATFTNAHHTALTSSVSSGTTLVTASISDTESDTPFSLTLSGTSDLVAVPQNANSSSYYINAASTLSEGTINYTASIQDSFGKTREYNRSLSIAAPAVSWYAYMYEGGVYATSLTNALTMLGDANDDGTTDANTTFAEMVGGNIGQGTISHTKHSSLSVTKTIQIGSGQGLNGSRTSPLLSSLNQSTGSQGNSSFLLVFPSGSGFTLPSSMATSLGGSTAGEYVLYGDRVGTGINDAPQTAYIRYFDFTGDNTYPNTDIDRFGVLFTQGDASSDITYFFMASSGSAPSSTQ